MMPSTRPGSLFTGEVCQACVNAKAKVDWKARYKELETFCEAVRPVQPYNCLIPVSGGKDSHRLVDIMVTEQRMRPLLVTVTDPFIHTRAGQMNLTNLIERFNLNHWQYHISDDLFRRATRYAFEILGEPLKFVEYAIYTIPYLLAQVMKIPLVVFGENSGFLYGSEQTDCWDCGQSVRSTQQRLMFDKHWWSACMHERELMSIMPLETPSPVTLYMSYFVPWDSVTNYERAKQIGFKDLDDTGEWKRKGTIEQFEQIDSVAYMFHLWMKYPKFGFQRVTDIASRRVRNGHMKLTEAETLIKRYDRILDPRAEKDFANFCGYTSTELWRIIKKFDRGYL